MNIKRVLTATPAMEKTDTRFHHASGKDTPLLVDTRMAAFLHKKAGASVIYSSVRKDLPPFHLFQMGKYSGSGRFLLLEQCRRRHRNRRLLPDRTRQYGHRSHPDRQRGQYFTKRSPDRIRSQLPGISLKASSNKVSPLLLSTSENIPS